MRCIVSINQEWIQRVRALFRRVQLLGIVLSVLWASLALPAWAGKTPLQIDTFTIYVTEQLRRAAPKADIHAIGPLTLAIKAPSGESTGSLDGLYSDCLRNRDACDDLVADRVNQMAFFYRTPETPLRVAQLRLVVRPSAYVETLSRSIGAGAQPIATPLVGDLWLMGAADKPTTIELLSTRLTTPMKLSPDEILARGRKNMHAAMKKLLDPALTAPTDQIVGLAGDPYEASLMAFPELWAKLDAAMGDDLIVAAPASDVVLFASGRTPSAVRDLKSAAQDVVAKASRPFSTDVFRWSPTGWVLVR